MRYSYIPIKYIYQIVDISNVLNIDISDIPN